MNMVTGLVYNICTSLSWFRQVLHVGKYKGKFKIKYTLQNKILRIRVRTYKKKGKKKIIVSGRRQGKYKCSYFFSYQNVL